MTLQLADYWKGRDVRFPGDFTTLVQANATTLLFRVNQLLQSVPPECLPITISSGWRPAALNAGVPGAARRSNHITGQAVDLADPTGALGVWCMANLNLLERHALWLESPSATKTWVHLQSVPPGSRKRVFLP